MLSTVYVNFTSHFCVSEATKKKKKTTLVAVAVYEAGKGM